MNKEQNKLVESHLDVVKWTIYRYIKTNERVVGLGYDDVYQEGCAALCKAAATFDGSVKFITYAQVVVKNNLISYCRSVARKQRESAVPLDEAGDYSGGRLSDGGETVERLIMDEEMEKLLDSLKTEYSGSARIGIEALELKMRGYSGADIARMYGVKPNLVGAWISRAASKLRQNEWFLSELGR